MQATKALREQAAKLLAADSTTLAPAADANLVRLLVGDVNETEAVAIGDLEFADFDGSAGLEVPVGALPEGLDPVSSDALISIPPPAGGFRWETTGITNLPQTVTGVALVNDDSTVLFAVKKLDTPITLTAINQVVALDALDIRQAANSMT